MYSVGVKQDFSAIHALVGDVDPEEKVPHPHEYTMEWRFRVKSLDHMGFSLDIAMLELTLGSLLRSIQDFSLNELPYFAELQTSLENLCRFFFDRLSTSLREQLRGDDISRIDSMHLRIWENENAWAGIEGNI
jgi:6-pyruvoyltetrahydropterin/6-carboxytetrahydropterin synthase